MLSSLAKQSRLVLDLLVHARPVQFSLRLHLILLVLAAVIPLMIFGTLMLWRDVELQRKAIERGMMDTVRALSLAVDRDVGKISAVLETLAASPFLDTGDFKSFYGLSSRVAEQHPGSWIVLFGPSGEQIVNTRRPFGSPLPNPFRDGAPPHSDPAYPDLPVGNPQSVVTTFATGQAVYSDVFISLVSKKPAITISVPVSRGATVRYALEMVIDPRLLTELLLDQNTPAEWAGAIVDRNGILIARKIDPDRFVGRQVSPELRRRLAKAREFRGAGRTWEGTLVYDAFSQSKLTGWRVGIAAPRGSIDAPVNRAMAIFLTAGTALLLVGAFFAVHLGKRIAEPLSLLAEAADRLQSGQGVEIPGTTVREVADLNAALTRAGGTTRVAIEERERRIAAEAARAQILESESRLRASEERLRFALDAAYVIAFDWDIVKNEVHRTFSKDPALPVTSPTDPDSMEDVLEAIHREDREMFQAEIRSALDSPDGDYRSEYRVVAADGSVRWLQARGRVQFDEDGRPVRLSGLSQDITERKQAEAALRRSEADLRDFVETASVGLHWVAPDGTILWVNQAGLDMLGYGRGEYIGRPIREFLVEDSAIAEVMAVLTRGKALREYEARLRCKDGTVRHVLIDSSTLFEDGKIVHARCFTRDITERKRTERALRESEERFRSTFENAPIGMAHVGLDGRWLRVNRTLCEIIGYSEQELLRRTFADITHPDDVEESWRNLRRVVAGEIASYSMEKRYVRNDGSPVWVEVTVSLACDADGRPCYMIGAIEDISERKAAQEALREADRRKDEFLAMLGHELRNPLGVISTVVQILRMKDLPDSELRELRDTIDHEVSQLARLLDDLLDVSRIARGVIRLRKERCDLTTVVRQVAEGRRSILEENGVELSVELPGQPLWVMGDRTRLAQILGNLLDNANKFTDPGGRVTVRLSQAPGFPNTDLTVRDTGIGMEPETVRRIFEPFTQADRTIERSRGGLGLGLALVKGLVDLHGGRVWARSEGPGRGSEFIVQLPLAPAATPPMEPVAPPANATGGYRILIIEDNVAAAQHLRAFFVGSGHQVEVAFDGSAGVTAARHFRPDVVLCDIGLPGMDGYAVAKALRGQSGPTSFFLIAVSGYGQLADQRRATEAGFDAFLTKPIDLQQVGRLITAAGRGERVVSGLE